MKPAWVPVRSYRLVLSLFIVGIGMPWDFMVINVFLWDFAQDVVLRRTTKQDDVPKASIFDAICSKGCVSDY